MCRECSNQMARMRRLTLEKRKSVRVVGAAIKMFMRISLGSESNDAISWVAAKCMYCGYNKDFRPCSVGAQRLDRRFERANSTHNYLSADPGD